MVDAPSGAVTPSRPWRIPRAGRSVTGTLDQVVLRAAIAGDEHAFAVVFRAVDPMLRRYAHVLVGQDADDVVGDAWLAIARDLRGFRGEVDGFRGWCVRIVRNRAIDAVRRDGRRPAAPSSHTTDLDSVAPDDTAAAALDQVDTSRAVALIASLPRDQGEAVFLRAVVGLDTHAAAAVLGKTPGAVRVAAHRGLRRLSVLLAHPDARPGDRPEEGGTS